MWFVSCGVFFCKQKTAYEMRIRDWSSGVCSSDLRCLYQSVASSSSISDVIAWCMASVSLLSRSRGACNPSLDIQSSFEVKNGGAANIPHTPQSPTVGKRKRSDNLREMTRRQRRGQIGRAHV